jgi:hypothetical protein
MLMYLYLYADELSSSSALGCRNTASFTIGLYPTTPEIKRKKVAGTWNRFRDLGQNIRQIATFYPRITKCKLRTWSCDACYYLKETRPIYQNLGARPKFTRNLHRLSPYSGRHARLRAWQPEDKRTSYKTKIRSGD